MPNPRQQAVIQWGDEAPGLEPLAGAPERSVNLVKDANGWIRRVPGTTTWSWQTSASVASEVIGITDFQGQIVYVTANRQVRVVEAPGLTTNISSAGGTTLLDGGERPVFARTRDNLIIAGGGQLQYWDGAGDTARVAWTLDAYGRTAPPSTTHVAAIAQRLVIAGPDGQLHWTEALAGQHLTSEGWDPLNFAEAEAQPDDLVALHDNSAEVYAFGSRTLQVFVPDANVGFAPLCAVNLGCAAAQSVIPLQDRRLFAWLSSDRRFVISNGRAGSEKYLSDPGLTRVLTEMATVSDCWGWRQRTMHSDLLCWSFPALGITYHYDLQTEWWGEMRGTDGYGMSTAWPVTAYHYWEEKGTHLVGLATGDILELSPTSNTVGGQTLRLEAVTGFQSRPTKCQTELLRLPCRRGESAAAVIPEAQLQYRDGLGPWSVPMRISLGAQSDRRPYVEKRVVGRPYVRRQWRLTLTDSVATTIGPLEETYEVLGD